MKITYKLHQLDDNGKRVYNYYVASYNQEVPLEIVFSWPVLGMEEKYAALRKRAPLPFKINSILYPTAPGKIIHETEDFEEMMLYCTEHFFEQFL